MNVNAILEWVKSNVIIVIFVVLMVAAPISMYFVAAGMNKQVKDEVNKRALDLSRLNTTVPLPDGQEVVPTESLLQQTDEVTKTLGEDAAAVQTRALEFNRKGRGVLMQHVFPEPPFEMRQVIPRNFHDALVVAYDQLLAGVKAGSPPELDSLRDQLYGMRSRFISQDLKKDPNAALEPDEAERLRKMLSEARVGMYKQAAGSVGIYATTAALYIPVWDQTHIPPPSEMFNWQWQYWVIEDVIKALGTANKDASSVADAPVKRVMGIVVAGLPEIKAGSDGNVSAGPPRAGSGFGAEGTGAQPPSDDGAAAGAAAAGGAAGGNPKAPITPNYANSIAGLYSNALYDVVTVDFAVVVETARLPEVLDAISRYNFNTITDLRVESADPFAATEQGYFYGNEPVCTATIRVETVWLREWTKPFMPPDTRTALGIASDAPARPATPPADAG